MNEQTLTLLKELNSPAGPDNSMVEWRIHDRLQNITDLLAEQILEQRKQTEVLNHIGRYLYEMSMDIKTIKFY